MSSIANVLAAETMAELENVSQATTAQSATQATANAPQTSNDTANNNAELPQQVFDLYGRGETVPQIAFTLNLSETAVQSYLALTQAA